MTTNSLSAPIVGTLAIASGVSAILALVALVLMFAVNPIFGPLNDVLNSLIGISCAVLAWTLYAQHHAESPLASQVALALAIVGAIFAIAGSVLVMFHFTGFVLAGWYTGVGAALIGLWLAAFCYSTLRADALPHGLLVLGLATGAIMALGLFGIPGIIARVDAMESLPWYLSAAFVGYLGTYILYPAWALWLGRMLLVK